MMLTEFEGTIDSQGLCMFRQCRQTRSLGHPMVEQTSRLPFWAVLEHDSALEVMRELKVGSRTRALRLLEELAFSLGTQWE